MVSPFLFFADERLTLTELSAACLDGVLVPLGRGFMPADAVETAWMRARSLTPLLGERWAAVRSSAAWVWGAEAAEPPRHHVQRVSSTRLRVLSDAHAVYHDVRLPEGDVQIVGGVSVSSPTRTLVDLARSDDAHDLAVVRAWSRHDPRTRIEAEEWLTRHPKFPHGRRAARVLSEAEGHDEVARVVLDAHCHDEVTRYTS